MRHTFAAKALTWPLLSTNLTCPIGVKQTRAHTYTDCSLDHLFLVSFLKHMSLKGVKERERTEECQAADMATFYIPSHKRGGRSVISSLAAV